MGDIIETLKYAATLPASAIWTSAVTGTVSPWEKDKLISDLNASLQQAGIDAESAANQAARDVTNTLVAAGADPSNVPDWYKTLGDILTWALILGVAYLLIQVIVIGKAWKEVLSP